jgi:hypothetical protein
MLPIDYNREMGDVVEGVDEEVPPQGGEAAMPRRRRRPRQGGASGSLCAAALGVGGPLPRSSLFYLVL